MFVGLAAASLGTGHQFPGILYSSPPIWATAAAAGAADLIDDLGVYLSDLSRNPSGRFAGRPGLPSRCPREPAGPSR